MRTITLLLLLALLQLNGMAQQIDYTISKGYQNEVSNDDYRKIVDLSIPVVARRYSIDYVKDGAIQLKKGQEMQALNLHNLIVKCSAVKDRSQWDKVIAGHFENMFASFDEQKKIDPANYETIKKYLSLRIYPEATVRQRGGIGELVAKTDLEGTYTLLMLDLPGAFSAVQKDMFVLWKVDTATVFSIAQSNINRQQIEKATRTFDVDGVKIDMSFLGNEDYAASYALDLMHNSPELVGEWGAVVAIPNKGLVDICTISKDKPVDFVKFISEQSH